MRVLNNLMKTHQGGVEVITNAIPGNEDNNAHLNSALMPSRYDSDQQSSRMTFCGMYDGKANDDIGLYAYDLPYFLVGQRKFI